jgi:hypothetical protein
VASGSTGAASEQAAGSSGAAAGSAGASEGKTSGLDGSRGAASNGSENGEAQPGTCPVEGATTGGQTRLQRKLLSLLHYMLSESREECSEALQVVPLLARLLGSADVDADVSKWALQVLEMCAAVPAGWEGIKQVCSTDCQQGGQVRSTHCRRVGKYQAGALC